MSDPAQHIQQGRRALRRRPQPKAAICLRHGRLEGADGGKRVNILGREGTIMVEIAGARGGQAGNIADLFDQVGASQPRLTHVEHGEMDPS